jgi:hypothetical protein
MQNRTIALTPVLTPTDATTTYTWSSSAKKIASVIDGVVTGVKPGKAVITVKTANNKTAACTVTVAEVSMTGFTMALADWQGDDCYYEEDADTAYFTEVVGHKMYSSIGNVAPADANKSIVWKSGNSKIASISSSGVITCKKPGSIVVTATSKYGGYKLALPVTVFANATYWNLDGCFDDPEEYDEDSYYTSGKSVYIKDGALYVEVYILNTCSFTIRRLSKQAVYLTLNYSDTESYEDYTYVGIYKPTLKGKIAPYHVGVATFKLGKIDGSKAWLTDADACCEGYCYSKDIGADVKAVIPYVSGASRRAPKTVHAAA